jgi:hypothetical protein
MNMIPKWLSTFVQKGIHTPDDLLNFMQCIQYGWVDSEKVRKFDKSVGDDTEFNERYRLMRPYEVYKKRVGVCQDQAIFEWYVLSHLGIPCEVVFLQQFYTSTHTFLVYKEEEKLYWFENSFQVCRGIHGPFSSIYDIVERVYQSMETYEHSGSGYDWCIQNPRKLIKKKLTIQEYLNVSGYDPKNGWKEE